MSNKTSTYTKHDLTEIVSTYGPGSDTIFKSFTKNTGYRIKIAPVKPDINAQHKDPDDL